METLLIALIAFIVCLSALWRIIRRPAAPRPPVAWYLATKDVQRHSRPTADEERMVSGIVRRVLENHRQAWLEQEGGDNSAE